LFLDKKILALIPARGGSKGIKDKNIYPINGKPLVAYAIEAARGSRYLDYIMVSTDSEKIVAVAKEYGASVPFMRDALLASDTSKTIDAVVDVINRLVDMGEEYDVLVLLQPTSPLRTTKDIDGAIEMFFDNGEKSLLSVSEVNDNPVLIRRLENNMAVPILDRPSTVRRQDFEKFYRVNGAIYINLVNEIDSNTSFNDNTVGFVMEKSHSVDIDTPEDVLSVEQILQRKEK
jgi:CMP-N-acetylneuraminic acid synthetase